MPHKRKGRIIRPFLFGSQVSISIKVRGKTVNIANPNTANDLGIGMVHQHFKLVHNFTVTENIILGRESRRWGVVVDTKISLPPHQRAF